MNWRFLLTLLRLTRLVAVLLVIFLVAYLMDIYDGFSRGMAYYPLLLETPVRMTVVKAENRNHRTILPDYVATGYVSNATTSIEVSLFQDQYRRLRHGGSLDVYPLPSGEWVCWKKLEESKPIFAVAGLHFSWHFPAGVLALALWFGVLPYLRRLEKPRAKLRAAKDSHRGAA